MKKYIVYDSQGKILRAGQCTDKVFSLQAGVGEKVIEGEADDRTQKVVNGKTINKET